MKVKVFYIFFSFCLAGSLFGQETLNIVENYRLPSPYQLDSTNIRILLPDGYNSKKQYRVLYVLPVIENDNRRFGDGLKEVAKFDFHNTHQLICVAPEFTSMPWYADHSTNMAKQDESHLLKTVIPFIDQNYPTYKKNNGRLLVGFSKSGWGAMTLLLRNPETFYKAAGWDNGVRIDTGPMTEEKRITNIKLNFGSEENFEKYRISALLKAKGKQLGDKERIFFYNTEGNRGAAGAKIHQLMVDLEIPHRYLYESKRKHRWDTGWIPEALNFLVIDI